MPIVDGEPVRLLLSSLDDDDDDDDDVDDDDDDDDNDDDNDDDDDVCPLGSLSSKRWANICTYVCLSVCGYLVAVVDF